MTGAIYKLIILSRVSVILLAFGIYALEGLAQHPITEALHTYLASGSIDSAKLEMDKYSDSQLEELPDSTLFDYYYLKAVIAKENGEENIILENLINAKKLCEKSQGIHSPVYLELCWAIGNYYEKFGDVISAFEIYQAAFIQSRGFYVIDDEDVQWQYEDIIKKIISWYQNDEIRKAMINNRKNLTSRSGSKDAVQYDMEYYVQFYDDKLAKDKLAEAENLMTLSRYQEAGQIYLNISDRVQNNPIAKASIQEMAAISYIDCEDYKGAEKLLLNNIELLRDLTKTKVYRSTLSQLANLYNAINNYDTARKYAKEAKFWYEEALDFSRGYTLCLHRCAALERGCQNYLMAMLMEDVAIQELYKNPVFGIISGSPLTRYRFLANMLSGASLHYNQFGFKEDAIEYLKEAIKLSEEFDLDASTYYSNLAYVYLSEKNYVNAVRASDEAYKQSSNDYGRVTIGLTLGLSQFLSHEPISTQLIKESSDCLKSLTTNVFSFTSMNERNSFWSCYKEYFPLLNFLAYYANDKEMYELIYNNILMEKGLLLRTTNNLHEQILKSGNKEDIKLYDDLLKLRQSLYTLEGENAQVLKAKIEDKDKYLTSKYSEYSNYKNYNEINWIDVLEQLGSQDIAIEFYNIPEVKWTENGNDVEAKYRYVAVILRKEYDKPHIIPLFTEDKLEGYDREDLYDSDLIYNLIWKPLAEELHGVKNIYFAAEKDLHKIAIEYSPLPEGGIMADKYHLYRLSSTRVLAEKKSESKSTNAVLYGGLRYDLGKDELIAESRAGDYHPAGASRAFSAEDSRYGVKYLPGTLKEVTDISQNFTTAPRMITDISGTEESFKSLEGTQIDIIHLATHGFFWTEEDAKKRDYVTFLNQGATNTSGEDKALMRSGLFFSGANIGLKGEALPDDVEDGVLTALELSNMNLGHVDMVVMSACESGLGETSGEGVFGLQRGFKLAGANTLLMSLWKVDDTATQLLMADFYRHYLSGKSKQESLRLAQQSLRADPKYSDPVYWAAFILLDGLNTIAL